MNHSKKGVEMSMNVIIIAAIALLILVIISVLVLRAGGNIADGTGCKGIGGSCSDECDEGYTQHVLKNDCPDDGVCCIPLGSSGED